MTTTIAHTLTLFSTAVMLLAARGLGAVAAARARRAGWRSGSGSPSPCSGSPRAMSGSRSAPSSTTGCRRASGRCWRSPAPRRSRRSERARDYSRGARLLRIRCSVRRCMLRRRAVSDTFRLHCSNTRWMCSQRTRSADIGLSRGGGRPWPLRKQRIDHVVGIDRLGEVVDRARLDRRDRGRDVAVAGHDHDPHLRPQLAQDAHQIEAAAFGQAHVEHRELGPVRLGVVARLGDAFGRQHVEAAPLERAAQRAAQAARRRRPATGCVPRPEWRSSRGRQGSRARKGRARAAAFRLLHGQISGALPSSIVRLQMIVTRAPAPRLPNCSVAPVRASRVCAMNTPSPRPPASWRVDR